MTKRKNTNRIIVHHSLSDEGNVNIIRQWHEQRGFDDIGYHFVITTSGRCEAGRALDLMGAHAQGKNADSIGVCFVGHFSKYPPRLGQIKSFLFLYKKLCDKYKKQLAIEPHRKNDNPCPGELFPLDFLKNLSIRKLTDI